MQKKIRTEWNVKVHNSCGDKVSSLSDIDKDENNVDSKNYDAFLVLYENDGNFISWSIIWSQGTVQFPPASAVEESTVCE